MRLSPELVLASRSPRRRQLLLEHGFVHRSLESGVDDGILATPARGVSPAGWTLALAWLKARAGAASAGLSDRSRLVLAADTVVVHQDEIIGQPDDAAEAATIIERLADDQHEVLTGVVLLGVSASGVPTESMWLVDRALVRVGPLEPRIIDAYVESGKWRGKAGGYNLREQIEAGWPIAFDGDPASIMGLPMRRLVPVLTERLGLGERQSLRDWADDLPDHRNPTCCDDDHLHDSAEGVFA